jgi:hypothetical protein
MMAWLRCSSVVDRRYRVSSSQHGYGEGAGYSSGPLNSTEVSELVDPFAIQVHLLIGESFADSPGDGHVS